MTFIQMSLMIFNHYLLGYVGTTICSIGLVLALCSVYIFTRRQMRSVASTYLAGLSISDSCLLLLGLVFTINSSIPPNRQSESFYSSRLHKLLFPYVYAGVIWFQFTSVWIIIGFAVDRWFAIKWPMLHYTYSSKRASYIVVTIYCSGFIYSLPRFFEYKTEVRREVLTVGENNTEYIDHFVIKNKLQNSKIYQYVVHLILYSLFQSILPLLMLSYFNVKLIRSVQASSHFIRHCTVLYEPHTRVPGDTNSIRYRETIITRSVICLIGLFIICQVPASILHFIYMFYRNHDWLYISYDISNFLILFNSAVNFFVFAFFNRKFRRELTYVCFRKRNRNQYLSALNRASAAQMSSRVKNLQQNDSNLKIMHSKFCDYQKYSNGSKSYPQRLKSIELEPDYKRTSSLRTRKSKATARTRNSRFSTSELNHKRNAVLTGQKQKSSNIMCLKMKSKQSERCYSCQHYRQVPNRRRDSSPLYWNNCRGQTLHYVTLRYKNQQSTTGTAPPPPDLVQSPINTNS